MAEKHPEAPFQLPKEYFTKHLGFHTSSPKPGQTEITLDIQPHYLNIVGYVHGGFLMTVLDTLMGHAVFTSLGDPQARFGTSQMTTHFLRTVNGGQLSGEGRVLSYQGMYLTAEAELRNEQGELVATAEAQFTRFQPPGR
ncbi:MAG: PaaI family thioesterase [Fidelibacterota bacterium]|nr:MAG: PaaI family thioesterase [Candidatus Neomarinimicrobiota bacterium]